MVAKSEITEIAVDRWWGAVMNGDFKGNPTHERGMPTCCLRARSSLTLFEGALFSLGAAASVLPWSSGRPTSILPLRVSFCCVGWAIGFGPLSASQLKLTQIVKKQPQIPNFWRSNGNIWLPSWFAETAMPTDGSWPSQAPEFAVFEQ